MNSEHKLNTSSAQIGSKGKKRAQKSCKISKSAKLAKRFT